MTNPLYDTDGADQYNSENDYRHHMRSIILAWINFLNFEVWEWISNFISHVNGQVISYPCRDWSWSMLVKGSLEVKHSTENRNTERMV